MISRKAQEGYVAATGGDVWYQIVGSGDSIPLLVLHGGPAVPHDYLEPLCASVDERPVVFYDQLGCGKSDRPDDSSLWRIERFVEEVGQVRQALGLAQVHLCAHSAGTMPALDYLLSRPAGVVSLIQLGPVLSVPRYMMDVNRLYAALPAAVWETVQRHEAAASMECEAYQRAVEAYYRRHMCRVWPWLDCFARARQAMGLQVYNTMWGPYELQVTGNLRDYDRSARAHEITVPTLLMCGRYDCTTPEETARYHGLVAGSEVAVFEQSAHFPYVEEPERFRQIMRDFLRRVEREKGPASQHRMARVG